MTTNFLQMSDEEFLNATPPEVSDTGSAVETKVAETTQDTGTSQTEETTQTAQATQTEQTETATETKEDEDSSGSTVEDTAAGTKEADTTTTTTETSEKKPEDGTKEGETAAKETVTDPAQKADAAPATPDYQAFYQQIMAPFKANGKMIELRSPAEAISLMQMGANYTRKLQELAPQRKVLMMLENNGLLDEGKLSYLIDLDKKNPEAIKKLIKEAGIDPLEIDTSVEPAYREGNHRVSEEEVAFESALKDLQGSETGKETLRLIHTGWDQASKEVLWKDPQIMAIMHGQRESGIYDRITAEIDRQRTLGAIPAEVPFLQAYKAVGEKLHEANAFADLIKNPGTTAPKATATPALAEVVTTRVAAPKAAVTNEDKANAASPTRTTPTKAKESVNYLAMSDEAFMKQWDGRV